MNFALNADGEIQPTGESVEEISKKLKQEKTVFSEKKSPKPKKTATPASSKKTKSPSDSRKDTGKDSETVDPNPVKESVQSPAKEIRKSEKDPSATPVKEASPKPKKTATPASSKKKHTQTKSMDFVLKDEGNEKKEKSPKKIKKKEII